MVKDDPEIDALRHDDFNPGQWIVISDCIRERRQWTASDDLQSLAKDRDLAWRMAGVPLLIVAVRLPFVMCECRPERRKPRVVNGKEVSRPPLMAIDTRFFRLLKVDRAYAKAWWRENMPPSKAELRREREWKRAQDDAARKESKNRIKNGEDAPCTNSTGKKRLILPPKAK